MGLITDQQFDGTVDVPIHLPQTRMEAGSWMIVASIGIDALAPVEATLRWLQLRMLNGSGSVTLGLYKNFNPQVAPTSQAPTGDLLIVQATDADCSNVLGSPEFKERDFESPLTINAVTPGAGTYSWVVYASDQCTVMVMGAARLNLNPD